MLKKRTLRGKKKRVIFNDGRGARRPDICTVQYMRTDTADYSNILALRSRAAAATHATYLLHPFLVICPNLTITPFGDCHMSVYLSLQNASVHLRKIFAVFMEFAGSTRVEY